ncbi:MAG: hypothetical protein MJE68_01335, partial [Proteobacteria bacterium]|nr:hypothetical protein [Pseudomonadota bacterium]
KPLKQCLIIMYYYIIFLILLAEPYESVRDGRFELLTVEKDCELADFIHQKQLVFKKGAVFYEFTRPREDINPDKEVILMEKNIQNVYIIIVIVCE